MSADDLAAVLAMKKVEVQGQAMTCPHCKKKVPIKTDKNGRRVSVSRGSSRGSRVSVSPLKTSSTTADGPGFLAMTSMAAPAAEPVSPTITMGDTELLRFLAAELLKANANIEKLVDASNEGIDDDMYQSESGDDATEDNSV